MTKRRYYCNRPKDKMGWRFGDRFAPKPEPSEAARRIMQEQFESESDSGYLKRLWYEQS